MAETNDLKFFFQQILIHTVNNFFLYILQTFSYCGLKCDCFTSNSCVEVLTFSTMGCDCI